MKGNTRKGMRPFAKETEEGNKKPKPSRGLKLIGVRFYQYEGVNTLDLRKAKCIQKSLNGRKEWFYFNKGFKIIEGKDGVVKKVTVEKNVFDSNRYLYSRSDNGINISVSAIVGQNGTGKSTIIDTVIRLLNNFSAAIIGEDYVYSSAEHLHYIDNVYASIAIYKGTVVNILTCKGRKLTLTEFQTDSSVLGSQRNDVNYSIAEEYFPYTSIEILKGNERETEVLAPQKQYSDLLNNWFYTLVSNYSLYAYNYRDYEYEESNEAKLDYFQKKNPQMGVEDWFWLKGVFHKNDGYQTPIVIHPMRENGYINAAKVNLLGKQNLVSLAFEQREGGFPFREINKTHHIVGFSFPKEGDKAGKSFENQWIRERFDVDENHAKMLCRLEIPIKEFWSDILKIDYKGEKTSSVHNKAWDYLAYKTIKVLRTYKQYESVWEKAMTSYVEADFKKDLKKLLCDGSHRTLKIRQTIVFLRFHKYKCYYLNLGLVVDCDKIWAWMKTKIGRQLYPNKKFHKIEKEDLLPPPFVDVVLRLVDNEHLDANKIGKAENDIIPFGGLSSGERQIAYTIGNILYHLKNIESGKHDSNTSNHKATTINYQFVNILLDEVELYFHPDLQRRFLDILLNSICGLQMNGCKGINITLVTHSPFVLSDIPDSNILYLSRDENEKMNHSTFAANIHDLFNEAFFLPNTMGEIAQSKVKEVVSYYNKVTNNKYKNNKEHEKNVAKIKYISSIVGDSYLHDELTDMFDEILAWKKSNNSK